MIMSARRAWLRARGKPSDGFQAEHDPELEANLVAELGRLDVLLKTSKGLIFISFNPIPRWGLDSTPLPVLFLRDFKYVAVIIKK